MEWHLDSILLTTERPTNCLDSTCDLLKSTYWGHQRPRETVQKILDNSLCFFLLEGSTHFGFARIITDYVTTSWVCDVVIHEQYRNRGLGNWMMMNVMQYEKIAHTQFALQTGTAHDFYQRLGFRKNQVLMSTSVDYL